MNISDVFRQVKRRQRHKQPVRRCLSLDYIPSDLEDATSVTSQAHSPRESVASGVRKSGSIYNSKDDAIVGLLKGGVFSGQNISLSSLESGSEFSRSDPALNYDSSSTGAYESEYDNYRPGMASDEDYFVPEPVSDVDLELFDDINLEQVSVSEMCDMSNMQDFINKNSLSRKHKNEHV